MTEMLRVIISGGGTGGHIFPAVSIANEIRAKRPDAQILFVGAEGRMEMQRVPAAGYEIKGLPIAGFDRKRLWRNIPVLFKIMKSRTMARRIVEEALKKIPDNYPHTESMTNAFYRETIQKRHRYIGVSEAMMEVYKTPYNFRRYIGRDKVHLTKARRLVSQKQSDTLAVKVMGGPNLAVQMDIAKNEDVLLEPNTLGYYDFRLEPSVLIDDRLQYVVSFRPRVRVEYALMEGVLYIDRERLSFTRTEFSLDLSDREKAVRDILRKKPAGLRFRPLEVSFLVAYRQQGGKTRLHYVSNVMRFKCDWKRRLFAATYTARSEMVAVEHEEHVERIPDRRQAFRPQQIFYDVVSEYWNAEYWKDYNIIEPTESLEEAVRKLRKR